MLGIGLIQARLYCFFTLYFVATTEQDLPQEIDQ